MGRKKKRIERPFFVWSLVVGSNVVQAVGFMAWHLSKEKVLLKVNSSVSIYDVKSFDGLGFCIIQGGVANP